MPVIYATKRAPAAPVSPVNGLAAGVVFNLLNSTKGNYGPCVRVKDSKVGKNRFIELTNGKLLTADGTERIKVMPVGTELVIN
jgi:hypothetical protein